MTVALGGSHLFVLKLDLNEGTMEELKRVTIKCESSDKIIKTMIYQGQLMIIGMDGGGVYAYVYENLVITLNS